MKDKKVAIIGCGGLGGNVANIVLRLEPKNIILFDGDKFSESNLDRQLFSTKENIGKYKAETVYYNLQNINDTKIDYYNEFIDESNINLLSECDIVFDCVDNIKTRLLLSDYCLKHNLVLVHGAVSSSTGEVCLCLPDRDLLKILYKNKEEVHVQNSSYGVAFIASLEVSIGQKYFDNDYMDIKDKLLLADLSDLSIKKVNI